MDAERGQAILELVAELGEGGDRKIRMDQGGLLLRLRESHPDLFARIAPHEWFRALWALLHQDKIYFDMTHPSTEMWSVWLTRRGEAAAQGDIYNPDTVDRYLNDLRRTIPPTEPVVLSYAEEAHRAYLAGCYSASVVMLGVASEVALLGLIDVFGQHHRRVNHGSKFTEKVRKERDFAPKLAVFRGFWESSNLPADITTNDDVWLNGAADVIRNYRNNAGHAISVVIDQENAHMLLTIFPAYLRRLFAAKDWLAQHP